MQSMKIGLVCHHIVTFSLAAMSMGKAVAKPTSSHDELVVPHKGKTYSLQFRGEKFVARLDSKEFSGEKGKQLGDYAEWRFDLGQDDGFELILNRRLGKIIHTKNDLDAGGPFLLATSPNMAFVVLDYGTAPTARELEVRDQSGKVLFKDSYLEKANWTSKGLEYAFPTSLPLETNEETLKCKDVGAAWKVEWYLFDGEAKQKLQRPATIECSN